jgi:hypothetical protein
VSSAVFAADENVKKIDRRNASEKYQYFIVFCARGASATGHAFVALGVDDFDAKVCRDHAFGLYPKEGKGVLGSVPGEIVDEVFKSSTTHRLIVQVNSPDYQKAEQIREKWKKQGQYRVVEKDCVTFVAAIAEAIRLKTPNRDDALKPQTFINEMLKLN